MWCAVGGRWVQWNAVGSKRIEVDCSIASVQLYNDSTSNVEAGEVGMRVFATTALAQISANDDVDHLPSARSEVIKRIDSKWNEHGCLCCCPRPMLLLLLPLSCTHGSCVVFVALGERANH